MKNIEVPKGLATYLGVYAGSIAALLAILTAIVNGDHTVETLTAGATAAILLGTTIHGRMSQAAAAIIAQPNLAGAQAAIGIVNAPLDDDPSTPVGLGH